MKFALIDGIRREPTPGAKGECPGCGQEVLAKCGSSRLWHWAHKGRRSCDPWWESETDWHRAWKNLFPEDWQEFPHRAEDGELHIADIRTPDGLVLELQHSAIKPEERLAREQFYKNMLWIVDGTRLKYDRPRIDQHLYRWRNKEELRFHTETDPYWAFPKRWLDARVPVLFDFDGLSRDEDFREEQEGRPPSVLRDKEWWNTRGARPDPLVYLLPNPNEMNSLYFIIRRETFLDAVVNEPAILDPADVARRYIEEESKRRKAIMSMRRGRRRGF